MKATFRNPPTPKTPSSKQFKRTPKAETDPMALDRKQLMRSVSRQRLKRAPSLLKQLHMEEPPKADKFDGLGKQSPKMVRNKSGTILKHLDQRDANFTHKYKQFKSHSKNSDFEEIKRIIQELLDKHAAGRSLTLSQQYILTGYMGKFIDITKTMKSSVYNTFNITRRLQTKNNVQSIHLLEPPLSPSKRSPSKNKKFGGKTITPVQEKRQLLNKQLTRLKFLWQIYKLKSLVCPELNKVSEFSENDSHHQMVDLINKLKTIERSRDKVGEEKSLVQVQKVMRVFEQTIKKCLC